MSKTAVILDCYTVEPNGLGVPPYLSAYVRDAYSALSRALPGADVRYLTIDDVRWVLNGGVPHVAPPLSDALTYSATANRDHLVAYAKAQPTAYVGLFDALHSHTVTSADLSAGSTVAAPYARLRADRDSYAGLVAQLRWRPIAEIELHPPPFLQLLQRTGESSLSGFPRRWRRARRDPPAVRGWGA